MSYAARKYREDGAYWSPAQQAWVFQTCEYYHRRGDKFRGGAIRRLRIALCEAQNWRCCYCTCRLTMRDWEDGGAFPSFEHVVPRSKGGSNHRDNLVIACEPCNVDRDNN